MGSLCNVHADILLITNVGTAMDGRFSFFEYENGQYYLLSLNYFTRDWFSQIITKIWTNMKLLDWIIIDKIYFVCMKP